MLPSQRDPLSARPPSRDKLMLKPLMESGVEVARADPAVDIHCENAAPTAGAVRILQRHRQWMSRSGLDDLLGWS